MASEEATQAVDDLLSPPGAERRSRPPSAAALSTVEDLLSRARIQSTQTGGTFETPSGRPPNLVQAPQEVPGRANVGASALAGLMSTDAGKIRVFSRAFFPELEPDEAAKRFGNVGGDIVFVDRDGTLTKADSGIVARALSTVAEQGPAIAGGTVGGLVGGPGGAALGAGAGEAARKLAGQALGEQQDPVANVADIGTQAALDAIGFKLGDLLVRGTAERLTARDLGRLNPDEMRALQTAARARGVSLTAGEVSNLPSMKSSEIRLAKDQGPAGDVMGEFLERRAGEVTEAIDGFIGTTSTAADVGAFVRKAAKSEIADAVATRSARATPFYEAARATDTPVNTQAILDALDQNIAKTEGTGTGGALTKVRRMLFRTERTAEGRERVLKTDIDSLHQAKLDLDDLIAAASRKGNNNRAARLLSVKDTLLAEIEKVSPSYAQGRTVFQQASAPVDRLQEGFIGLVAGTRDRDLLKLTDTVLKSENTGPVDLGRLREMVERRSADGELPQDAWDQFVNVWLRRQFERASTEGVRGPRGNVGGRFRQLVFGSPRLKRNMEIALGPERFRDFQELMKVLEATTRVDRGQSITAFAQEGARADVRAAAPIVSAAGSPLKLRDWYLAVRTDRYKENLAKLVTSNDPEVVQSLRALRKLPKSSQAAVQTVTRAIVRVAASEGSEIVAPPANSPPTERDPLLPAQE